MLGISQTYKMATCRNVFDKSQYIIKPSVKVRGEEKTISEVIFLKTDIVCLKYSTYNIYGSLFVMRLRECNIDIKITVF